LFKYFKFGFDNFVDFIFGENLWESNIYIGYFGNHKWGYSDKSLTSFVEVFGIQVDSVEKKGLNLRLKGRKIKHVRWTELDEIKIPSHANRCGNGKPEVTLVFAREKISEFQKNKK
jgi:hypothetical protein